MERKAKEYGDDTFGKKLYVGNLDFRTDAGYLKDKFGRYGDISDVFVPRDPRGDPRGFAFITFEDRRDASEAAREMDGKELDGRRIGCNVAKPRPPLEGGPRGGDRGGDRGGGSRGGGRGSSTGSKLYIGNLAMDTRERDLEDMFDKYGPIRRIDLKVPSRPPAYGFVEYEDRRDAEDAQDATDGKKLNGETIRVEFSSVR